MMCGWTRAFPGLGILAALGCITVNINFPEKQVEEAAEVIVDEARPPEPSGGSSSAPLAPAEEGSPSSAHPGSSADTPPPGSNGPSPGNGPSSGNERADARAPRRGRLVLASFGASRAADDEPERDTPKDIRIEIDTPVIKEIRKSLAARFTKLRSLYDKGAIGEGNDGYLHPRDDAKLSLTEKRDRKALFDEENRDRRNLYLEILKANKFDEDRLKDVQRIFAREWIKKSRTGWWIQDEKGEWVKKPPPPKEKKPASQEKTEKPKS